MTEKEISRQAIKNVACGIFGIFTILSYIVSIAVLCERFNSVIPFIVMFVLPMLCLFSFFAYLSEVQNIERQIRKENNE